MSRYHPSGLSSTACPAALAARQCSAPRPRPSQSRQTESVSEPSVGSRAEHSRASSQSMGLRRNWARVGSRSVTKDDCSRCFHPWPWRAAYSATSVSESQHSPSTSSPPRWMNSSGKRPAISTTRSATRRCAASRSGCSATLSTPCSIPLSSASTRAAHGTTSEVSATPQLAAWPGTSSSGTTRMPRAWPSATTRRMSSCE
mmetsp:Transcript_39291/g.83738  ORF Transcript_39291/g.83738 Transcript_39291/m.83738 type:complete len:201 (+) Transcript_39291:1109-1711(+)